MLRKCRLLDLLEGWAEISEALFAQKQNEGKGGETTVSDDKDLSGTDVFDPWEDMMEEEMEWADMDMEEMEDAMEEAATSEAGLGKAMLSYLTNAFSSKKDQQDHAPDQKTKLKEALKPYETKIGQAESDLAEIQEKQPASNNNAISKHVAAAKKSLTDAKVLLDKGTINAKALEDIKIAVKKVNAASHITTNFKLMTSLSMKKDQALADAVAAEKTIQKFGTIQVPLPQPSNAPNPSSDAPKASSSQPSASVPMPPSASVPMQPGFEQMYAATQYKIAAIDKKIAADKVAKSILTKSTKGVAVKPSNAPNLINTQKFAAKVAANVAANQQAAGQAAAAAAGAPTPVSHHLFLPSEMVQAGAQPPAAADQPAKPNEGAASTGMSFHPVHSAGQMMMAMMSVGRGKGPKGPTPQESHAIKRAAEQANRPVPTFALLPIQKGKLKVFRKGIDDFRQLLMKNDFHTKS